MQRELVRRRDGGEAHVDGLGVAPVVWCWEQDLLLLSSAKKFKTQTKYHDETEAREQHSVDRIASPTVHMGD